MSKEWAAAFSLGNIIFYCDHQYVKIPPSWGRPFSAVDVFRRIRYITNLPAYRFPKEPPDLKNRWILATGRKNWFPTKNSSICSAHFHSTDFNDTKKSRRLSQFAYPTIDVWRTTEEEESSEDGADPRSKKKTANDTSDSAPSTPDSQNLEQAPSVKRLMKQRKRLLAALKLEKMKVKRFREQNRRKDKKIATLHNIIFNLKKKMMNKVDEADENQYEEVIVDNI